MRSMTGFGQAAGENGRFRVSVTLRGVNNRFLDLVIRLRDSYRAAEPAIRTRLAGSLRRGRVDVGVEIEALGARQLSVDVDQGAVRTLAELAEGLRSEGVLEEGLAFGDLLRLPEVVRMRADEAEWLEEDQELLLQVVGQALEQLLEARDTEGEKLFQILEEKTSGLAQLSAQVADASKGLPAQLAASLRERLAELLGGEGPEEERLAQEVALLVDRTDVSEELDRLRTHLEHFAELLGKDGSIGKRLDFLTQEILRELNTLGSKCRDGEIVRQVLEGKSLCEQLREQVQNVE